MATTAQPEARQSTGSDDWYSVPTEEVTKRLGIDRADGRIVEASSFQIDESALMGESVPGSKGVHPRVGADLVTALGKLSGFTDAVQPAPGFVTPAQLL
jgi:hypothetical protein